jgi:hypothetical protein
MTFSTNPISIEDCDFYHVMDLPGVGRIGGQWDLRGHVDEYLGNVNFGGKRVIEIGPASGFLTVEMEKRGATVQAVEVTDEPGWDFVPFPAAVLDPVRAPRAVHLQRVKNSFWFTHAANKSSAKIFYGDAYNLPDALGQFDIAVMAAVLLHTRSPLAIMEQCARRADTLIVTDCFFPELEGSPVCRLNPSRDNKSWDTWWHFSTDFFAQFVGVLGYETCVITRHEQMHHGHPVPMFTIIASN